MKFATAAAMRRIEEMENQKGTSYLDMMTDAGNAAARIMLDRYSIKGKLVAVLCGKGNNGGDGIVAAGALMEAGAQVWLLLVKGEVAAQTAAQAMDSLPEGVTVVRNRDSFADIVDRADYIVDAVYGIGFSGELADEDKRLFACCKKSSGVKISLDLPSGAAADSGRYGCCFVADLTIAMAVPKAVHLVSWNREICGETVVAETPLTQTAQQSGLLLQGLTSELFSLPRRLPWSHKGDNGRLAVVCGSRQFPGAAVLSCQAALRSGVGYVRLCSTQYVCEIVAKHCPEVIFTVLPENRQGGISASGLDRLLPALKKSNAILAGCGLGNTRDTASVIELLLNCGETPLLLDADGINAIAPNPQRLGSDSRQIVLTPHPGEFSRLAPMHINDSQGDYTLAAAKLSLETGAVLLLKGPVTGIFRGREQPAFSFMGNDGLAKGGSGDLLSGMIASLMAQGLPAADATFCGSWLHGRCAGLAAEKLGRRSMLPSDLIACLPAAFRELER